MTASSAPPPGRDLLDLVMGPEPPPFAILHRPDDDPATLDVMVGDVTTAESLADIPLPEAPSPQAGHDVLAIIPYRLIAERGFDRPDDGSPLLTLAVAEQRTMPLSTALSRIPDVATELVDGRFDLDDVDYAETARRIISEEIGTGAGSNFVLKRSFVAEIRPYSTRSALAFFRRLLTGEQGAYWTFIIHTGGHTFVGASPERHITLRDGTAVMNPISGTYRYPATGPTLNGALEFLADRKETDELYMVLDEELKMMARVCDAGGRVVGPYLKEMARLAHTEYFIEGRTSHDVRAVLRETMFAPTVTGSPVENACRVIARYEPGGRGYYSGIAALIGHDGEGRRTLDSSILIRTADIDARGRARIGVGATLVRHSDPVAEVAETRAKAAGLLAALESGERPRLASHPRVRAALERRNEGIADFWLCPPETRSAPVAGLAGRSALVIDAEDTFTAMIDHQLRSIGLSVTVRRYDRQGDLDGHDLVVMGPGPGDPTVTGDPKIDHLRSALRDLLDSRRPFLAVCLSHQVLSMLLGFTLCRRDTPAQGLRKEIDLFGAREQVGFYNTFAAFSDEDKREADGVGVVEVSRDPESGEVHALRSSLFVSLQFHAESVLTVDGPRIIETAVREVLRA